MSTRYRLNHGRFIFDRTIISNSAKKDTERHTYTHTNTPTHLGGQERQRVFNKQPHQSLWVEDELVTAGVFVPKNKQKNWGGVHKRHRERVKQASESLAWFTQWDVRNSEWHLQQMNGFQNTLQQQASTSQTRLSFDVFYLNHVTLTTHLMMVWRPRTCGVLSNTLRVWGNGWDWWAVARSALCVRVHMKEKRYKANQHCQRQKDDSNTNQGHLYTGT